MESRRLTGPGAASRKYDILTALGTFALGADRSTQRRVLRLITLITARYNWARDELSIGRSEIARLWSVDERTVKREIGALKALGFIGVKRPGARGRVTTYAVNMGAITQASEPAWDKVGPDFRARMDLGRQSNEKAPDNTIVPFPKSSTDERTVWGRARVLLSQADRARAKAWFDPLHCKRQDGDTLTLQAPSQFHATYITTHLIGEIIRAIAMVDPRITNVSVTD